MIDPTITSMIIPGGALLGITALLFLRYHLSRSAIPYLKFKARKYVSDRPLPHYMRSIGIATPLYLIALLVILAVNITLLAISGSRLILIKRSGNAFLVNLTLLIFGGHPNIFSDRINVSKEFKCFLHQWLGAVALLECIVHVAVALSLTQFRVNIFSSSSSIAGLTSAICLAILSISSLPFIRRHIYEFFHMAHLVCTIASMILLFLHLQPLEISSLSTNLLMVSALMCVAMMSIRIGLTLWLTADVGIFEEGGLLRAEIHLRRPCKIHAGQYVCLRIPSTSLRSFNESHPFFISSWDNDGNDNAKNITVLIQRMSGFTRRLRAAPTTVRAFIEGPYGHSPVSGDYGNFILFASGIGIAAHLGSIKQLLDARDRGPSNTQVISLLWEVDEIERWDTAIKMVHQLLDQDGDRCQREAPDWPHARSRYIFRYTMFVRQGLGMTETFSESRRGRQRWESGSLNTDTAAFKQELANLDVQGQLRAKTLISVCANQEMTDAIRKAYVRTLEMEANKGDIIFHNHDFHPES